MTIVSVKAGTAGEISGRAEIRRIELSDGTLFSFKTSYLPSFLSGDSLYARGSAEGRELSDGEAEALRFAAACLRAERAALRLIARAEQSYSGLTRKLKRGGHENPCIRAVLGHLSELGVVNDGRFAEFWLISRLSMRTGSPRALLSSLRNRGIAGGDAEAALKKVLDADAELALLERYAEKNNLTEQGEWSFICSKLKFEGFSPAVIQRFREERE
ncbi:MAG: recombination regulator RecX [Treponema sp.]|jgi:regulatory protein|nr:recombination regulator RecX [Treponema sp.]